MSNPKQNPPGTMDCVVVGGCAGGQVLRALRQDATFIELRRPDYIKPLESAQQEAPEIEHEKDTYEVHPISLTNTGEQNRHIFGIAVIKDESLTWAFSQIVIGYVQAKTVELTQTKVVTTN